VSWQLVIDAQGVQGPFSERGIARTITAVAEALAHRGAPVTAVLLNPHHPLPPSWHASLRHLPLMWSTAPATAHLLAGPPIVWLMLSPMEGSFPDEAIVPAIVVNAQAAVVPLVHDAIPFDDELRYQHRHADARMHQYRLPLLRQAAHTLAVSRYSADDWSRLVFPLTECTVVGSAPTPQTTAPLATADALSEARRIVPGLTRTFAMYVGGGDARKNVQGAMTAWSKLDSNVRERFQFVIVGSAPVATMAAWQEHLAALDLEPGSVLLAGRVSDAALDALHQAAHLAFFPSLSEGFGMPVVEAVAWGTPVICSNTTSMPEIIGWVPGMFDPTDADDMSAVLHRGLVDDEFRAQLLAEGAKARDRHTWAAVAGRICATLEAHVVPNLPTTPVASRPSVAIVTSESSPDSWAVQIASELHAHAEVTMFAAVGHGEAFPLDAFGRTSDPGRFTLRVFVLGDHPEGAAAYTLARRFPGVLVLTDERLTRIGATAAGGAITALLADCYDTRLASVISSDPQPSVEALLDHDIRLLCPVVQPAHEVVAANEAIAAAAALDLGPWNRPVSCTVATSPAAVARVVLTRLGVEVS
jgi:glycosyltransferase involved in cell wall biosynthesis